MSAETGTRVPLVVFAFQSQLLTVTI